MGNMECANTNVKIPSKNNGGLVFYNLILSNTGTGYWFSTTRIIEKLAPLEHVMSCEFFIACG